MAKSPDELAELKRFKQLSKQRIAQIFALLKDKTAFDLFIKNINELASIPNPPATDAEKIRVDQLHKEIKSALFLTSSDDPNDDELTQLVQAAQTTAFDEATMIAELHAKLIAELGEYVKQKDISEAHWAARNASYDPSKLREWNNHILQWLQNNAPVPTTIKDFADYRAKMASDLKKDIPDLEDFLAYRQERAEEKYLVTERPWAGATEQGVLNAHITQAQQARKVSDVYGKEPVNESAVLYQQNYRGRTGSNAGNKQPALLRVYNIGFNHDQVLEVFRNLENTIEVTGGHAADGKPNPVRNLKFKIGNDVYGIAARPTADGKRVEYLKYKESDYVDWLKDPANTAKSPKDRGEDFITFITNKYGKRCELSGDDCARQLITPQDWFHRPGDTDKAVTVTEGINNAYGLMSVAAGKTDVLTNIKEYPNSAPGAGVSMNPTGGTSPSAAAGASLNKNKHAAAPDPAISSAHDDDEDNKTSAISSTFAKKKI